MGQKYKRTPQHEEPAVPLGVLFWDYYNLGGHPDIDRTTLQSGHWESGITRVGQIVPIDMDHINYSVAPGYKLRRDQELAIVSALERALGR